MVKRRRIGIIGLGLIGGSVALALSDKYEIVGYDVDESAVRFAKEHSVCFVCDDITEMRGCEVVFVCVPLACMRETLEHVAKVLPDEIISDVGSVKTPFENICKHYVGGHPMAGVERGGIERAKANLFKDAYWVLTGGEHCQTVENIVTQTGAAVVRMSAAEHDISVARYSHAPHAAAYALVAACSDVRPIAGSGFLDTTRIAQSDEKFWSKVFELNADNVSREIKSFIAELDKIDGMIERNEFSALAEYLKAARTRREALNRVDLGGEALYVDLLDRVGEFERVTGAVAKANVSMTNIALIPSREGAYGALRLEFASADDMRAAKKILTEKGYVTNETV